MAWACPPLLELVREAWGVPLLEMEGRDGLIPLQNLWEEGWAYRLTFTLELSGRRRLGPVGRRGDFDLSPSRRCSEGLGLVLEIERGVRMTPPLDSGKACESGPSWMWRGIVSLASPGDGGEAWVFPPSTPMSEAWA